MTETRRQMMRFALIGGVSTALYFGLLMALRPMIPSTLILTAICYGASMGFNFLTQAMFTFRQRNLTRRQIGRYVVMHGAALVVNSLSMKVLVDGLNVHILIAQIFVTSGVTVATFLLSRAWVYT